VLVQGNHTSHLMWRTEMIRQVENELVTAKSPYGQVFVSLKAAKICVCFPVSIPCVSVRLKNPSTILITSLN